MKISFAFSKPAGYSTSLSSQISGPALHSVLSSLGTLGSISVDRKANKWNGWSWSITFHSDVAAPVGSLIYADSQYLYSTSRNASLRVYTLTDPLQSNVSSPLTLRNASMVNTYLDLTGATLSSTQTYSGAWTQPSLLRITVTNTTAKPTVLVNKLKARLKVPITGYYGKFYPSTTGTVTLT